MSFKGRWKAIVKCADSTNGWDDCKEQLYYKTVYTLKLDVSMPKESWSYIFNSFNIAWSQ